jgi:hypothetical protein
LKYLSSKPNIQITTTTQTMKKLLLTAALVAGTISVFAQGTVNFNNSIGTTTYRILDTDGLNAGGTAGGQGTNFFAQLYWAAGTVTDSTLLQAAGFPVNLRSLANGGLVQTSGTTSLGVVMANSTVTLSPLTPAGSAATLQLRAWWGGGSIYPAYYNDNLAGARPEARFGQSALFTLTSTGDPTAAPPGTPSALNGLSSFQLKSVTIIPEPTTFALAGLGAAAVLIFRRRK